MGEKISRLGFLRKITAGAMLAGVGIKASTKGAAAAVVSDNLGGANEGIHVGDTPPKSYNQKWIDTSTGGVLRYWNGAEWKAVKSVWM